MSTKVVFRNISYESLMTFRSRESIYSSGRTFLLFFSLQSSFAELRPLDFGIGTICQSNVSCLELNYCKS